MNKRWLGVAAVVALIALPVLLKRTGGETAKAVSIEQATPRSVRASILASGNLVFREQSQLSPEVIGKVRAVLVEEGDQVEPGQVVLQLDEQVYRAEVAQAEAFVRQQRINIERQQLNVANQLRAFRRSEEVHRRKLIDDARNDEARHAYEMAEVELRASRETLQQAEAQLAQARERLAKTEIRAPIAGTVMAVAIKVGETAVASSTGIAGSSLMTIADTASLMTEVNVDEADIARIAVGQEVAVYAAAFPETAIRGTVESIPLSPRSSGAAAAAGSSLARSYSVKVRLERPEGLALRPGMTCRAEIYTSGGGEVLAVPVQAVLSNNSAQTEVARGQPAPEEEHHVFVEVDGKAERRVVKVGVSDDSHQEIREGLAAGERVVVGPYKTLRHLKAGDALRVDAARSDSAAGDDGKAAS
jgi:HlyD family secretion protein